MNTQALIKSVWEADSVLNTLCAVDRVYLEVLDDSTDRRTDNEYPYVVIQETDDDPVEVTSGSFIDEVVYVITIYAATFEHAKNIQRESRRVLRAGLVPDDGDGNALLFEKRGGSITMQDNAVGIATDEYVLTRQRYR